jgi:pyruvate formate lyase activating enzyme
MVFDIQRYSLHDGPGIRTIVFLKGCPLRCLWCSNPESQCRQSQVEFFHPRCQHCGRCLAACPRGAINADLEDQRRILQARCDGCDLCVQACPNEALRMVGREMRLEEVLVEVERDREYYRRSGGGITLSGGEPLAQPGFARALLQACYDRNIHTALETSGYASWKHWAALLEYLDLVLYDLKHMDSQIHRRLTGVPNEPILENARRLAALGQAMVVRLPLIPACNTDPVNVHTTARFVASLGLEEVHLMPFHQLGQDKYHRLGRDYAMAQTADLRHDGQEYLEQAIGILSTYGLQVQVGG